jgi:hypothetical protein
METIALNSIVFFFIFTGESEWIIKLPLQVVVTLAYLSWNGQEYPKSKTIVRTDKQVSKAVPL